MEKNKMSFLSGSLLWFGAAISIAEIITGALLVPLGFAVGMLAIIAGHIIGCILLYFAGLIGAKSKMSAMESVSISFGRYSSVFFSVLNILQLIGWTAVMIISGAAALGSIANEKLGLASNGLWCILIGVLIVVWIIAGLKNVGKLNLFAVGALFILTAILAAVVFSGGEFEKTFETMSFGLALELSIAMPISWLPLISDYTKNTDKPVKFTLISTLSYFIGSSVMYTIGLGAAIFAGSSDIVQIMMRAGLGFAALLIIILATVTTTFLDVYSAGQSMLNILPKLKANTVGIIVCIIGTLIALFTPIEEYENFLYLIGSVFVPMAVIMITDYFILKRHGNDQKINITNTVLWIAGFIIYRMFMNVDIIIGSTVPVIFIITLLCVITDQIKKVVNKNV